MPKQRRGVQPQRRHSAGPGSTIGLAGDINMLIYPSMLIVISLLASSC